MERKDFHNILKKYLEGQASAKEERLIDKWYEVMGNEHQPSVHTDESTLEKQYWRAVDDHIKKFRGVHRSDPVISETKRRTLVPWYATGIAASVLLMIGSFIYLNYGISVTDLGTLNKENAEGVKWQYITNTKEEAEQFSLPDGSEVVLNPQSRLKFSSFVNAQNREIYLEGEAFFEVFHNEHQPFLVHANGVTTKVLGTSFSVKAFQGDKNVTVAVRTGRVSVYTHSDEAKKQVPSNEIILTPNQQIIYDKTENRISRRIVEAPQVVLPPEEVKRMRFESAPVKEIFEAIEKVYGVDLVFDEDQFLSCTLTTSISDGGLYSRLDIICKAIGATYALNENKIVIDGTGCN